MSMEQSNATGYITENPAIPRQKLSLDTLKSIRKLMDEYHLDPLIGLVAPGAGDWITTILTIPYLITSIFKLKSLSLTLAIIYNILMDCLWGTIPVAGDVFDFLHRGFKQNCKLVEGFANQDPKVMSEVKRKSIYFGIMIVVLLALIVISIYWVTTLWGYIFDFFRN